MPRKQKASKRKKRTAPPTLQSSSTRLTRLIPVALVVGLLIVGLAAWLTPPGDDELPPEAVPAPMSGADSGPAQTADESQPSRNRRASLSDGQRKQPAQTANAILRRPLQEEAESVDAAKLKVELVELAKQITASYSQDSKAHHVAGQIYAEFNQSNLARLSWQRCVELKPTHPGPYLGLAELLQSAGEDSESLAVLHKAESLKISSPGLVLSVAQANENLGKLEVALQTLNSGVLEYPDDAALFGALGRLESQSGDLASAENNLNKAIQLGGQNREVLGLLVTTLARQKKREEAEQFRKHMTRMKTEQPPAAAQPTAVQSAGEDEQFRAAYDLAAQQFAYHMFLQAAAIAEHEQNWEAAELWAHRSQALQPNDSQCYVLLGSIYRNQAKLAAAIEIQQRLVRQQPRDVVQYTNLASLAFKSRNMQLAERTLLDAIAIDPQGHSAASALAQLYIFRRDFLSAQKVAVDVVRRNSQSADSYLLLGSVSNAMGDQAGANSALVKARELEPNHPAFREMPGASQ